MRRAVQAKAGQQLSVRLAGTLVLVLAVALLAGCAKPPVIDRITADPNPVGPNAQSTITAEAHDPQGEALIYHWSLVLTGSGRLLQTTGNPVVYEAPKLSGEYRIALRVLDAHSRTADDTLTILVQNPCR